MAGNVMVDGTINTELIFNTHRQIKTIAESFKEVNREVSAITRVIEENWVGKGRNAFSSQYDLLISKIEDFGDTLLDIYDALVDAEAEYEATDDSIRQDFVMAMK